jgi:DNA-directed RNA polymerase specialized sigma24 family protein
MAFEIKPTGSVQEKADFFSATSWTVVLQAQAQSPEAAQAMEILCNKYWYPVYCFIRRRGNSPHDAEDLTQGFFFEVINNKRLRSADRSRGKFRAYLLAGVNGYLANHWHFTHAAKRGGGKAILSLDAEKAENRFTVEPAAPDSSPENIFERRWAETVMENAQRALEEDFRNSGKAQMFEDLRSFLAVSDSPGAHAKTAERLGMTENAFTVAVHRLRQKFRKLIRAEIARTVAADDEVEPEMRRVYSILAEN